VPVSVRSRGAWWAGPALLAVLAAACGGPGAAGDTGPGTSEAGRTKLAVATTVAPITSIVATVAGDLATVTGIVPEGTNSHTFEPKPSIAELLATVDVVFVNGLGLEEPTVDLARASLEAEAELVELGARSIGAADHIYDFSFPKEGGRPNPHLWTHPRYADRYARTVQETLARRDPANAAGYAANYAAFSEMVTRLDHAMRQAFDTIPEGGRKLLTYHDAYAYFARDYGWEVIGAIQVSDFEDPSPREIARLIDQVRAEGVRAIFGSEVFPSPVLEQIGQETGAAYVDVLRDDDLPGKPGEARHSWFGLMRFNYATLTRALGGDSAALDALAPPALTDRAVYPQ